MKDLNQYIGKIFCHTPKAVKQGEPEDRLFFIVGLLEEDKKWLVAWKVTLIAQDMIDHPGFDYPMPISLLEDNREMFFERDQMENGAGPTAVFKPDSLYQEWTPPEYGPPAPRQITYKVISIAGDPTDEKVTMMGDDGNGLYFSPGKNAFTFKVSAIGKMDMKTASKIVRKWFVEKKNMKVKKGDFVIVNYK